METHGSFLVFVFSKIPTFLFAYGFFATIGWFFEDEEKNKETQMPSLQEILFMDQEEKKRFFNEKFPLFSMEEQNAIISQLVALQKATDSKKPSGESSNLPPSLRKTLQLPRKGDEEGNIPFLLTKADAARQQGQLDVAEDYYKQALVLLEKDPEIGPKHFFCALTQYALALIKKEKGEHEKAEQMILKILPIMKAETEKTVSFSNPNEFTSFIHTLNQYADVLAVLSDLYFNMEKYDKVEPYLNESFSIVNKKSKLLDGLAIRSLEEKKQVDQARTSIRYELAILKDNMSRLRWKQKKYTEAESLGKEALQVLIEGLMEKNELMELVIKSMKRLADIYKNQGKSEDNFYEELLHSQEETYGAESNQILVLLPLLGVSFFSEHKYSQAEKCYQRAIVLLGKQPDSESDKNIMTLLTFMNDTASAKEEQGKTKEAQELRDAFKNRISQTNFNPPPSLSRYLKTVSCNVKFDPILDGDKVEIYFEAIVETKEKDPLPKGTILEFNFENPSGEAPYKVDYEIEEGKQTLTVKSPNLPSIDKNYYSVPIFIYSNNTKTEKIGSHYLWAKSPVSASGNDSSDDVTLKIYESNAATGLEQGGGVFSF